LKQKNVFGMVSILHKKSMRLSKRVIELIAIAMFPVLLVLAFAMHFKSAKAFLNFRWRYQSPPPVAFYKLFSQPNNQFVAAHVIAWVSVPLLFALIWLMYRKLYPKNNILSIMLLVSGAVGCFCLSGVFAIWLHLTCLKNVADVSQENMILVVAALTAPTGVLRIVSMCSLFAPLTVSGLSIGLLGYKLQPVWSSISLLAGSSMMAVFMDQDNWMLLGAFLITIGIIPLITKTKKGV
jgi:hypothetical protein